MKNKGFGLLEAVIALGITGVVVLAVMNVTGLGLKTQFESNLKFSADNFRKNIIQHLNNPVAWTNTVNDAANASLLCLRTNANCAGGGGPFRVRDASNNIVWDAITNPPGGAAAQRGITPNGELCSTFNQAAGNDACPLRLNLTWTPVCPAAGACISPPVRVTGAMTYRNSTPARTMGWRDTQYGIDVIIGTAGVGAYHIVNTQIDAFRWPNGAVYCPVGEVATGGGAYCQGQPGIGWAFIFNSSPTLDGRGWSANCDTPENQNVRLHLYVVCTRP